MPSINPDINDVKSGDPVYIFGNHISENLYRGTYTGLKRVVKGQESAIYHITGSGTDRQDYYDISLDDSDSIPNIISNRTIRCFKSPKSGNMLIHGDNLGIVEREFDK